MQSGFANARERATKGLSAFEKLLAFHNELRRRAAVLRGREGEINAALAEKEATLDEAIVQGGGHIVQGRITDLKLELASIRREIQALESPPAGAGSFLHGLTMAAWVEATDEITGPLRAEWDGLAEKAEALKRDFLAVVAELGAIKRKADRVSGRISEAILTMPGPKMAVPTLATGIISRPDRHAGVIFLPVEESEAFFKGEKSC